MKQFNQAFLLSILAFLFGLPFETAVADETEIAIKDMKTLIKRRHEVVDGIGEYAEYSASERTLGISYINQLLESYAEEHPEIEVVRADTNIPGNKKILDVSRKAADQGDGGRSLQSSHIKSPESSSPGVTKFYHGRIGEWDAVYRIVWKGSCAEGVYTIPSDSRDRVYDISGRIDSNGDLTLSEFLDGELYAYQRLTGNQSDGREFWRGTMDNVSTADYPMYLTEISIDHARAIEKQKEAPHRRSVQTSQSSSSGGSKGGLLRRLGGRR